MTKLPTTMTLKSNIVHKFQIPTSIWNLLLMSIQDTRFHQSRDQEDTLEQIGRQSTIIIIIIIYNRSIKGMQRDLSAMLIVSRYHVRSSNQFQKSYIPFFVRNCNSKSTNREAKKSKHKLMRTIHDKNENESY